MIREICSVYTLKKSKAVIQNKLFDTFVKLERAYLVAFTQVY